MGKLQVKIIHRSGRITGITSHDYLEGQFRQWCENNLMKNDGNAAEWVIWNDCMININEIEKIEVIKS